MKDMQRNTTNTMQVMYNLLSILVLILVILISGSVPPIVAATDKDTRRQHPYRTYAVTIDSESKNQKPIFINLDITNLKTIEDNEVAIGNEIRTQLIELLSNNDYGLKKDDVNTVVSQVIGDATKFAVDERRKAKEIKNIDYNSHVSTVDGTTGEAMLIKVGKGGVVNNNAMKVSLGDSLFDSEKIFQRTNDEIDDNLNQLLQHDQIHEQHKVYDIPVPSYFHNKNLSQEHIASEIEFFMSNQKMWSQRVILENLYHNIFGVLVSQPPDYYIKKGIRQHGTNYYDLNKSILHNWLKDDVDVCMWKGIICESIEPTNLSPPLSSPSNSNFYYDSYIHDKHSLDNNDHDNCWCISSFAYSWYNFRMSEDIEVLTSENNTDSSSPEQSHTNSCKCPDDLVSVSKPPMNGVTQIDFRGIPIIGKIPSEIFQLPFLTRLILPNSVILDFPIPTPTSVGKHESYEKIRHNINQLRHIDFSGTQLPESFDITFFHPDVKELLLRNSPIVKNENTRTHIFTQIPNLKVLDLHGNQLSGTVPSTHGLSNLEYLDLGGNEISGSIPSNIGNLSNLQVLNLEDNLLYGGIPEELSSCTNLKWLNLGGNALQGDILSSCIFSFKNLKVLGLNNNYFGGSLSKSNSVIGDETADLLWKSLKYLVVICLHGNEIRGEIPSDIFVPTLKYLDLSENYLTGTIPDTVMNSSLLKSLFLHSNKIEGKLPRELQQLKSLHDLDITNNIMTGDIDESLCFMNNIVSHLTTTLPCTHYLACPAGTFHPDGKADKISGCTKCSPCFDLNRNENNTCNFLGQNKCSDPNQAHIRGDLDGDGSLSQREVLRLLYVDTLGEHWGGNFYNWGDAQIDKCDLLGVNCKNGLVTKIDLRGAKFCDAPLPCKGIPSEIGLLHDSLEVLDLSGSWQTSKIEIPKEIGFLTNLRFLDLSGNIIHSTLPDEIGSCTLLRTLNLLKTGLTGTIPASLGNLKLLEKLNLSGTLLESTIPSEFGQLTNLRDLTINHSRLQGKIPNDICNLTYLRNFGLFDNELVGTIPDCVSKLRNLSNIDIHNNRLTGTLNALFEIPSLTVIHLKNNTFYGTIPTFPTNIRGLDLGDNNLEGTIPSHSNLELKELYVGNNKLQPPIPPSLCSIPTLNTRIPRGEQCEHIACSLGQFRHPELNICQPCPEKYTTLYLGSEKCQMLTQRDFLMFIYDTMNGNEWSNENKLGWNDNETSECNWSGVTCDENGNIESLEFPLAGIQFDSSLFMSSMER